MDILIINSSMVLNLVMVNYELYRRNHDFGQSSYIFTELLLRLLRRLLLRRDIYGTDLSSCS